jgi:hypothetical protein
MDKGGLVVLDSLIAEEEFLRKTVSRIVAGLNKGIEIFPSPLSNRSRIFLTKKSVSIK